jgi:hypothetical protein
MSDDPTTEELRLEELRRERHQRDLADRASLPDEERAAERRADKAAYLADKLREQADAQEQ